MLSELGAANAENWMRLIKGYQMRANRVLQQLEAYWEALRPIGDIPSRDDINPSGIADALDFAFILERTSTGKIVFRLGGQKLGDLLGVSLDGIPVTSLFTSEKRRAVQLRLDDVFQSPSQLWLTLRSEAGIMGGAIDAQMLVLPLRGSDAQINRAVGALVFYDPIGKSPRLFSQIDVSAQKIDIERRIPAAFAHELQGLSEDPSPFVQKEKRPTFAGRPNLTLIKGGMS